MCMRQFSVFFPFKQGTLNRLDGNADHTDNDARAINARTPRDNTMRRSEAKPNAEISLSRQLLRGLREGALLVFGMLAVYLLASLLSYHPNDPGWSFTGDSDGVRNLGGAAGAWFADLALHGLGYLAYLLPVAMAAVGWRLFRYGHSLPWGPPLEWAVRAGALLLSVLTAAALLALHSLPRDLPVHGGGILGDWVARFVVATMGLVGGTLFLLTLFLAGFTLLANISWFRVMDQLGHWVVRAWQFTQPRLQPLGQRLLPRSPDTATATVGTEPTVRILTRETERIEPVVSLPGEPQRVRQAQSAPLEPVSRLSATGQPSGAATPSAAVDAETETALDRLTPARHTPRIVTTPAPVFSTDAEDDMPDPDDEVVSAPQASTAAVSATEAATASRGPIPIPISQARTRRANEVPAYLGEITDPHPPLDLLDPPPEVVHGYSEAYLEEMSRLVEEKLADFGVQVEVVTVQPGPVITRFELNPAAGVKVARISALAKDLARSLSVIAVRIVEVIPGRSTVGLEIPNEKRELVSLSEILHSPQFTQAKSSLTMALGKDIGGAPVVADLARMPHLLVAGTTGSGKSVGVNAMLISMLYKSTAEDVRLILIDPKMLELSVYEGIPHLLAPVVTDMKDAANALRWAVAEMERRYKLMSMLGVRNIAGFNKVIRESNAAGEPLADPTFNPDNAIAGAIPPALEPLPCIVVVVDEFADMIMVVGKKVEELIARLAQKARAAGIHLILATQRPSVDVITGLIKANIPTRIAFQVSSRVDSRTILDQMGAEHLLGHGDMLYLPPGKALPERVHGAFVADHEVHKVVEYVKATGEPDYEPAILEEPEAGAPAIPGLESASTDSETDPLYDQAVQIVMESGKASISFVQRRLKIGYNRAARMVEDMEAAGLVSPIQSNGNREVLVPKRSE